MTREDKRELIKEKIINVSKKLFYENSFEKVTADMVSEKAEISKRTLYKYFSGKKIIHLVIVKEAFENFYNYFDYDFENLELKDLLYRALEFSKKHPDYIYFINSFEIENFEDSINKEILSYSENNVFFKYFEYLKKKEEIDKNFPSQLNSLFILSTFTSAYDLYINKKTYLTKYLKVNPDFYIENVIRNILKII